MTKENNLRVPLQCPHCARVMNTQGIAEGTIIRCQQCHRKVRVPQAAHERHLPPVPPQEEFQLAQVPAPSEDARRTSHARQLLMAAHQQLTDDASHRNAIDEPIRRQIEAPVVRRSWWQLMINGNVWPQSAGMIMGGLALSGLIDGIVRTANSQSHIMILAVFFLAALAILGTLFLSFVCARLLDILEMTANDTEGELIEWPDYDLAARFGRLLTVFNAVAYAAAPAALMGIALRHPAILTVFVSCSLFVLFPILLMCLLDNGSLFVPFSARILNSIQTSSRAWMTFYLRTFVLGIVCIPLVALTMLTWPWRVIAAVVVVGGAWTYFRWMGVLVRDGISLSEAQEADHNRPASTSNRNSTLQQETLSVDDA